MSGPPEPERELAPERARGAGGERPPADASARASEAEPGGARFWVLAALGLGIVAFGVAGLLRNVHGPALQSWATFVVGSLIAHDGVAAPAVALASAILVRLAPASLRPPLQAGLVVSVLVLLVAIPVVDGEGRLPNNPSLLPSHHYAANLLGVLGAVWLLALGLAVGAGVRARRRRSG